MTSAMRAVPDDNWSDLADDKLVTRADIAACAGVKVDTVRIWSQTCDDFPQAHRVQGYRPVFHRWGDIHGWLCRTGRIPCDETAGLLSKAQVAEMIGRTESAFKQMRVAGKFPEPDARVQRAPFWRPLTVKRWQREHPPRSKQTTSGRNQ